MKRKLLLAALCVVSALGFKANAQETPENNGVYYMYNQESGLFLTRGNNWGTRAVARPIGMPWKVSIADGKYTLRMYDLTVAGSNTGFGDNAFTDNGNPLQFTPAGNATDGFTLTNDGGLSYITCPASADDVNFTATASKWQFLTQAQYDAVLAAKVAAQESDIATLKSITIPAGKTLNDVVSDATNWAASAPVNDGVPTSDKWTATKFNDRGGNINWNVSYGTEMYQVGNGHYTRTITGLKKGIYKVTIRGMKRMGNNATCTTMGNAGYPVSDSYLSANGYIIRFKAWYEDRVSDNNPNSTGDFVNIVNKGGYTTEGFAYVGDDGNLYLDASSEAYWGGSWFLFNGISYTYYDNEVSDDDATAAISTAEGLIGSPMGSSVRSALSSALNTFKGSQTIANYNSLQAAISNANTSIASYADLLTAINNANNYTIYKPVFAASSTMYNSAVNAANEIYTGETVVDCSDAITALTNSIHSVYESDYSVFANDYPYDYSTLLNPDMTKWASTDYVTMEANEHWNGLTSQRYYEQSSAEWGQNAWTHAASETLALPAGDYVMSITARASEAVTSSMSVKVGDADALSVTLTNKGAVGLGITTDGVGSFSAGTYARSGEGYGWEYRYIAFTVAEESNVTISFSSATNEIHNWVSLASPLLKGSVHPNQVKLNQVKALVATLTGYQSRISSETYATFTADILAANNATVESTDLDDIIVALQADITIADTEAAAYDRGAIINSGIIGENVEVWYDEATANNWDPAATYNNWSVEGDTDGSGMVTPFLQNWVNKGSYLPDNNVTYVPIKGVQNGYYEVSVLVRAYNENGNYPYATSATFNVNGQTDDLMNGEYCEYSDNNALGVYKTAKVRLQVNGDLNIGFDYSNAEFNWLAWKDLRVTYLCAEPASASDYYALNSAINAAEANTLGFIVGKYAPYNNAEALEALAAAKAINQSEINSKSTVNNATTALTNAIWTVNTVEQNAVYDGNFALAPLSVESGDAERDAKGWVAETGSLRLIFDNTTENCAMISDATSGKGVFGWNGTYAYGKTAGYTMPLEANTVYNLTLKYAGWQTGGVNNVYVSVLNDYDEGLVPTNLGGANGINTELKSSETLIFNTGIAGNYTLKISGDANFIFTDVALYKAPAQQVNITASGFATYSNANYALDLTNLPNGLNAYYVASEGVKTNYVKLTEVTDVVPAGTGLLFKGVANALYNLPVAANGTPLVGNQLVASDGNQVAAGNYVFAFENANPTTTAGFYILDAPTTVATGKAYLSSGVNTSKALRIVVDGEATEVIAPEIAETEEEEVLFNMAGIRVDKNFKGYVVNQKGEKRFNR